MGLREHRAILIAARDSIEENAQWYDDEQVLNVEEDMLVDALGHEITRLWRVLNEDLHTV